MLTDEELVAASRSASGADSRELLETLFGRYTGKLSLWCYRLTGDTDEASDLAQEVLLAAFQELTSFRGESKFSTWLYTIMRNRFFNQQRSRKIRPLYQAGELPDDLAASTGEFLDHLEESRKRQRLHRLLNEELNETERRVMLLHYGEEVRLEAVTRLLGLTNDSGAKAFVVSARRKLQRAMQRGKGER